MAEQTEIGLHTQQHNNVFVYFTAHFFEKFENYRGNEADGPYHIISCDYPTFYKIHCS